MIIISSAMEFPPLYRKSGKKTSVWSIKVVSEPLGDKSSSKVYVVTKYGLVDGKEQEQKRTVKSIAREKSFLDQGIRQARKKWEDKKKKDGYTENIGDDRPFLTPMLATTIKFGKDGRPNLKFPFFVQPKLDGFRCMAIQDLSPDKPVKLLSRQNIEYKGLATLKDQLSTHIFSRLPKTGFGSKSLHLDGELFIPTVPFEELSGTIKRAQNNIDVDIPDIQYQLFDCFDTDHLETPFHKRTEFLRSLVGVSPNLFFVETFTIADRKEMDTAFSKFMEGGNEGLIARKSDSPYQPNKRSSYLKKYKTFQDSEFKIVGYEEASGNDRGTVIWICETDDGKTFNVRPRGSREQRRKLFEDGNDYIGKNLTVIYQELSEMGIPRFPVGKCIRD